MSQRVDLTRLTLWCCLVAAWAGLAGCAGVAEGVTTALIKSGGEGEERLQCEVVGPAFDGVEAGMRPQPGQALAFGDKPRAKKTKVMVVHGIGPAKPAYSARLQRNLAKALGLTVRNRRSKRIDLRHPAFEATDLGTLTISRYMNKDGTQEVLFYEL
ncbi:MAG: hypothetical protein ACE5NA_11445, partial [Nitrospiraceae bacterium]